MTTDIDRYLNIYSDQGNYYVVDWLLRYVDRSSFYHIEDYSGTIYNITLKALMQGTASSISFATNATTSYAFLMSASDLANIVIADVYNHDGNYDAAQAALQAMAEGLPHGMEVDYERASSFISNATFDALSWIGGDPAADDNTIQFAVDAVQTIGHTAFVVDLANIVIADVYNHDGNYDAAQAALQAMAEGLPHGMEVDYERASSFISNATFDALSWIGGDPAADDNTIQFAVDAVQTIGHTAFVVDLANIVIADVYNHDGNYDAAQAALQAMAEGLPHGMEVDYERASSFISNATFDALSWIGGDPAADDNTIQFAVDAVQTIGHTAFVVDLANIVIADVYNHDGNYDAAQAALQAMAEGLPHGMEVDYERASSFISNATFDALSWIGGDPAADDNTIQFAVDAVQTIGHTAFVVDLANIVIADVYNHDGNYDAAQAALQAMAEGLPHGMEVDYERASSFISNATFDALSWIGGDPAADDNTIQFAVDAVQATASSSTYLNISDIIDADVYNHDGDISVAQAALDIFFEAYGSETDMVFAAERIVQTAQNIQQDPMLSSFSDAVAVAFDGVVDTSALV
ncbi:MAG: hypothetical protein H6855_01570 [Rhodospirillales bacterium]|nr:hypothetical protein [Rhodospirillales bacterium]MCB9973759.1 hypothetical protein [Rhodospirillales bacterium]MCB9980661.1 hypothetical protein [Rhodospirillales bacterium]